MAENSAGKPNLHSGNGQNDVKLCFVEDDGLLAKVTCNSMEHSISSRL